MKNEGWSLREGENGDLEKERWRPGEGKMDKIKRGTEKERENLFPRTAINRFDVSDNLESGGFLTQQRMRQAEARVTKTSHHEDDAAARLSTMADHAVPS